MNDKNLITIRLNAKEQAILEKAKIHLSEEKPSTAFKKLSKIGYYYLYSAPDYSIIEKSIKSKDTDKNEL